MRLPWIKLVGLLIVIWAVVGGVILWARASRPTPESVTNYLAQNPVRKDQSSSERGDALEKVAKQLNQLTYEERREVRMSRKLDGFFRDLNADEQNRFLDLTLPTGF